MVARYNGARNSDVSLCGIAIEGDVQAASIVLGPDAKGSEAVRDRLSALKAFPVAPGRTIGFMFCCCSRGSYFHEVSMIYVYESECLDCYPKQQGPWT